MFRSKTFDFEQHCNNIGQYLRKLRMKRDLRTADVEIVCAEMQNDFLHSSIGAVHSNYIRTMIKCHNAPLRILLQTCQYKAVSSIIDWMYTGEIQVAVEEYREYLKAASGLGVNKLQQSLESTLQLLAEKNDNIICCINIATDPECSVSPMIQETICKKFVAIMNTLSDTDIQKLTLNAITALVASPQIKSKEKIDAINFALQWLEKSTNSSFRDAVLGSLYIETLQSDELITLINHLRRLYQEVSKDFLTPFHINICNEQIVISGFPRKYCRSNSVILSISLADISEPESKYKNAEMKGHEVDTSDSIEINNLPSYEELIKIQQPTNNDDQGLTDTSIFQHPKISDFSSKLGIQQKQNFFQSSSNTGGSLGIRLAAAGIFDKNSNKTFMRNFPGSQNFANINQSLPTDNEFINNADARTAVSAEEVTIGRNSFSGDSLTDIREIKDLFSHECTRRSNEMTSSRLSDFESTIKTNLLSPLFPYSSQTAANSRTTSEAGRISSPSAETINRNLYGVESVTDIANIPKQFHTKRYFTPDLDHYMGGRRAVYNLTEQIRYAKDQLYSYSGSQNTTNNWYNRENSQESDLQTINRYAFGVQSLADIRAIKSPFSKSGYGENLPQASRSDSYRTKSSHSMAISGTISPLDNETRPYVHYTTSEIQDINAHPEFVREDQVIGKKAMTREEYEELREIPSISEKEKGKSPIINRYELPDDELSDIKQLPSIVDSQYTVGRDARSEEEIQEIQALPDIHSYLPASDTKASTARDIYNRPNTSTANPDFSSAYFAPEMRPRSNSPVSEYIMKRP